MTADVVNLRTARKRKARADREAEAARNRAAFGQTKAEKKAREANTELDRRRLDQVKRERPHDNDDR